MIKEALSNLHITALNEMQNAALNADTKRDLILLSPTGSGKTLGFLLPVIQSLQKDIRLVQVLILVPSRELALQIEQVFKAMATGFKVNCCYGGHSTKVEKNNLSQPPAVLIGTPGRIAFHLREESFSADALHTLVLDEFDKSLEFGFQDDMSIIIRQLPNLQRRILTSATKMSDIPAFTGIQKAVELNYLGNQNNAPDIVLKTIKTEARYKLDTLFALICKIGNHATLVFCNHREAADHISNLLWNRGIEHGLYHGGMEQEDRERALIKFRNGSHRLLVTTDLASRGLDIPEIGYIIHYQLPVTEQAFIHRNGRTARMHAKGTAYLILADDELPAYLKQEPEREQLLENISLPEATPWATLYIAAGKKDKINKIDIVGLLLKKGDVSKEDVGRVEVLDKASYVAINRFKINELLQRIKNEKIKNKRVKIELSK
ncbi:DEAD/DEAH box helicase [Mucilaginibacter ximonensis]|uniref:DEAD/DEAH box helicase n=1 Tax=Mucilaginibacter ximonensis TaxID=538021 RepID=A0ABW5Y843_9SPHI